MNHENYLNFMSKKNLRIDRWWRDLKLLEISFRETIVYCSQKYKWSLIIWIIDRTPFWFPNINTVPRDIDK